MYASDDYLCTTGPEHIARALPGDKLTWISAHHHDIETHCASLVKLAGHLLTHAPDDWTRETAETIIRFFDEEYRRVRSEIEQRVYPRLMRTALPTTAGTSMSVTIDDVVAKRANIEWIWADLRDRLCRIKNGEKEWLRKTQVRRFAKLNADQIALETELLPLLSQSA